jgi:hypothetical protein
VARVLYQPRSVVRTVRLPSTAAIRSLKIITLRRKFPSLVSSALCAVDRYTEGGHFSPHTDGYTIWDFNRRSFYSCLMYLNTCGGGGATRMLKSHGVGCAQPEFITDGGVRASSSSSHPVPLCLRARCWRSHGAAAARAHRGASGGRSSC